MTHPCFPATRLVAPLAALLVACGATAPPAAAPTPARTADSAPAPTQAPPTSARNGAVAAADDGHGRGPTPNELAAIARLEQATERVRHLTFVHPVAVEIHDQVRISAQLSAMIKPDELAKAKVTYTALGLIDPGLDLRALLERLNSEQVIGYYDPKTKRLVVRDDVMSDKGAFAGDESSAVLVHELTHALQDQRLGLGAKYDQKRDTDADDAFGALVEGDATLAMIAYVLEQQGAPLDLITRQPALLEQVLEETPLQGMQLEKAPPIVRVAYVAPYTTGLLFCATLYQHGGWAAIDAAHRHPPTSTAQVLHPHEYLSGHDPEAVKLPPLPQLRTAGLRPYEDDTLGELEMGVYFAEDRPDVDSDERAAAGWSGDRLRVYRDAAGHLSVVWFTLFRDGQEAQQAFAAADAVQSAVPETERARYLVERVGRAVLIVRNLAPDLQAPVRQAFQAFTRTL